MEIGETDKLLATNNGIKNNSERSQFRIMKRKKDIKYQNCLFFFSNSYTHMHQMINKSISQLGTLEHPEVEHTHIFICISCYSICVWCAGDGGEGKWNRSQSPPEKSTLYRLNSDDGFMNIK